jgi:hypothetical protein
MQLVTHQKLTHKGLKMATARYGEQDDAKELYKLKLKLPLIQNEITSLLASIYINNPELKEDDDFKSDILEGSTDYLDIVNKCLLELSITTGYIEGIKITRTRIEDKIQRYEKREQAIRSILRRLLEIADMKTVRAPNGTISLAIKTPVVQIINEDLLPEEFMRIKKEPNRTLIGQKLKAGEDVPGATLSNGGETLIVR